MATLDQIYAEYQGQSLLVPGADPSDRGQCVQWADYVLKEVYGLPYVWANAIDWWNLPQSLAGNFTQVADGSIKKGDFVIFNSKVGSIYGHIDVAMANGTIDQFTGADSNWSGNKTVHLVNHVGRQYVVGSLRLKGEVQEMPITKEQEMAESYLATGSYPGENYDYRFVGTADYNGMISFWSAQQSLITKEIESRVADAITGTPNVIGKDYNSSFVGKPIVSTYPAMVDFWTSQPKAGVTVLKKGLYQAN